MEGTSLDLVQDLINQLKQVVPQAFTEGKLDTEQLKTLLGEGNTAEGERYALTWAGKTDAYKVLQTPTTTTLNPEPDKSIKWDETENVLIEGENLEVLKVLQKSYYGKVKMIYIDPPYNTGNDSFIYPDKFSESKEDYLKRIGDKDDEGLMMREGFFRKNNKENGQFHSNWLNMMLPRLFLARNLLKEDGVIFVSIDDNEQANLKLLMDEIFGAENFVSNMIWQSRTSISNDQEVSLNHNHTFIYSKSRDELVFSGEQLNVNEYSNPDNDERGNWKLVPIDANKQGGDTKYGITNPNTGEIHYPPPNRSWTINPKEFQRLLDDRRIMFGTRGDSAPKRKIFLSERLERGDTKTPSSVLLDGGTTKDGTNEVIELFDGKKYFT